jgi:acetylglutamate kinase
MLIRELDAKSIAHYASEGVITDGMKVKVDAALASADTLQRPVFIASWIADIADILNQNTGTQIKPTNAASTKSQQAGDV